MEEQPSKQCARTKAGTAQPGIAAGVMTPASSVGEWDTCEKDAKTDDQSVDASRDTPSPFPPLSTHEAIPNLPLGTAAAPPPSPPPTLQPTEENLLSLASELASLRTTITNLESRLEAGEQEISNARELLRLKDFIIVESARQTSEVERVLEERERKLEGWKERFRRREGEIERLRGEMKGEMRGVVRRRGSEGEDVRGGEMRGREKRSGGREIRGGEREMRGVERRGGSGGREGRKEDTWREDGWGGDVMTERGGQTWVDVRVRLWGGGGGG